MKEFSVSTYDLILSEEMSPLELLWVYLDGDTTPSHRFVRATRTVAFGGYAHTPLAWSRGAVQSSHGKAIDQVSVSIDNVSTWFSTLATQRPLDGARLKIIRVFQENWSESDNHTVVFDGRIQSMNFDGKNAGVEVVSHLSFLRRPAPGRLFMPQCNYRLGTTRCGVNLDSYSTGTIVGGFDSTNRTLVNASLNQADNYWAFSYVKIMDGTYKGLSRPVGSSSKDNTAVYLRYPFPVSMAGLSVKVVAGCQKTASFCSQQFGNLLNYGGFKEVPRKPLIPVPD
jgi:uncharacterized phage protein (TIGR02218 family)